MKKLISKIKTFLNRYPRLKKVIKKIIPLSLIAKLKSTEKIEHKEENFETFYIKDIELKFSLEPLKDLRGIGRVAQEQYAFLKKNYLTKKSKVFNKKYKTVYFHSSIHWCPKDLPKNSVIMIHDVIPMNFPKLFPQANHQWTHDFYEIANKADHIITISQTSKSDIKKHLHIPAEKISIVNNGVSHLSSIKKVDYDLPKDFFVYLGSYDPHKNLNIILEALCEDEAKTFNLVMIGSNEECKPYVKKLGIEDRVHFLGRRSDEEIGYVFSKAIALLFPSLYEGFGLPPMEAALLDVPSICSDRPTMSEFLYDHALFADPYKSKEWATQMQKIATDPSLRQDIAIKAKDRVSKLTWEKSCQNLVNTLVELHKE